MLKLALAVRTLPFVAPVAMTAPQAALSAPAPLSAPALFPAHPLPAASESPSCAASATATAPAPARAYDLSERRGRDSFGHEVVVLDLVDRARPEQGTVGHVDYSRSGDGASLDQPLDTWLPPALREENLSHFRPHLWYGLAVRPEHRGAGLGARLMDEAVARMKESGVRTLFIRATEESREFYLRRFGPRVRAVETEDEGEGGVYYRLEIDLT